MSQNSSEKLETEYTAEFFFLLNNLHTSNEMGGIVLFHK